MEKFKSLSPLRAQGCYKKSRTIECSDGCWPREGARATWLVRSTMCNLCHRVELTTKLSLP
jgi:hypothetical protein